MASSAPPNPEPTIARSNIRWRSPAHALLQCGQATNRHRLPHVHLIQSRLPRRKSSARSRRTFQIPQVGEHAATIQANAISSGGFERGQTRGEKQSCAASLPVRLVQRVSESVRRSRLAIESKSSERLRPVQGFVFVHERRLDQDENPQRDNNASGTPPRVRSLRASCACSASSDFDAPFPGPLRLRVECRPERGANRGSANSFRPARDGTRR